MATRRKPEEAVAAQGEWVEGDGEGEGKVPTSRLVREIIAESGNLVRKEVELARAELGEKLSLLQKYLINLIVGCAILACALFFLLSALDRGFVSVLATFLDDSVAAWLAPLILALLLGAVGAWLVARARRMLRAEGLVPEKTMATLRENSTWIKERLP